MSDRQSPRPRNEQSFSCNPKAPHNLDTTFPSIGLDPLRTRSKEKSRNGDVGSLSSMRNLIHSWWLLREEEIIFLSSVATSKLPFL